MRPDSRKILGLSINASSTTGASKKFGGITCLNKHKIKKVREQVGYLNNYTYWHLMNDFTDKELEKAIKHHTENMHNDLCSMGACRLPVFKEGLCLLHNLRKE